MQDQTLSGIRILDLTWVIAGPYCTKMFADYGADVLKIERPPQGDPARSMGPFYDDDPHPEKSLLFSHLNTNKRSILLDLKSKEGREMIKSWVKEADILVESFRPGVMERLGLDCNVLREINPRLVMTSISNFGQSGPYRDFKVSELVLNGIGADMYSSGLPGRHPLKLAGNCLQYQVGHMAAVATLAAYWYRMKTGLGQHIDISMQEVLATDTDHKSTNLLTFAYSGQTIMTEVLGRFDPREGNSTICPTGVYPCQDGFVRTAGGIIYWERFLKLFPQFNHFEWPEDILDVDNNKPEVDAAWYEWCSDRTKNEIMKICQGVKYFGMAINTPLECVNSPQLKERGFWVEIEHPVTGKQFYPGDPLHASLSPWKARRSAPLLGQDNKEVMDKQTCFIQTRAKYSPAIKTPSTETPDHPSLPLEGMRVLDMTVIWAGPTAAWLLGVLGAEVIHLDNPHHRPDYARGFRMWLTQTQLDAPAGRANFPEGKVGAKPWNRGAFYTRALWNRLSCCIDVDRPEGKEVFKRLIKNCDIFIENNSSTAMENLGFGHEILMEVNPRLICINMSAWGQSGPYKDYVGWGAMHQAIGGEEWLRGYNDDEFPFHNNFRFHMDSASPPMAVFGAIMGLMQREMTGKGQWIDFAQMQALIPHLGEIYMDAAWNGRDQKTIGNRHPTAIQGCYLCRGPEPTEETAINGGERWINITINNDQEWQGLCQVMGHPKWSKSEKFATQMARHKNHDELDAHIEAFTRNRDNFELFYVLQDHGVPAGPVEDHRDSHMDPQLNFREFFHTMTTEDIGTYRYSGFPWKFSETPLKVTHPPCAMGEDNEYVYREVIGLTEEEISDLKEKDVIGDLEYDWAGPMPEHIAKEIEPY